jgi:DNA-binding response OmpR family regulator
MQEKERPAILVASCDPRLADVRKRTLESAGFVVILARDSDAVGKVCTEKRIRLVMLGYSLAPADKRRIWKVARELCQVPILELHRNGDPEIIDQNVHYHEAITPDDFLEKVLQITRNRPS